MGCEFSIRLETSNEPISVPSLEEVLSRAAYFHGRNSIVDQVQFEFRGPNTKPELSSIPDVTVAVSEYEVTVCQFGDYEIAAQVLGILVMELTSESKFERVEVVKP